jgi:hypothetical protein
MHPEFLPPNLGMQTQPSAGKTALCPSSRKAHSLAACFQKNLIHEDKSREPAVSEKVKLASNQGVCQEPSREEWIRSKKKKPESTGLEPATSAVTGQRSNRLS